MVVRLAAPAGTASHCTPRQRLPSARPGFRHDRSQTMNTRTVALLALVIAVIVLLFLLL
jgi:hypothetical protein